MVTCVDKGVAFTNRLNSRQSKVRLIGWSMSIDTADTHYSLSFALMTIDPDPLLPRTENVPAEMKQNDQSYETKRPILYRKYSVKWKKTFTIVSATNFNGRTKLSQVADNSAKLHRRHTNSAPIYRVWNLDHLLVQIRFSKLEFEHLLIKKKRITDIVYESNKITILSWIYFKKIG